MADRGKEEERKIQKFEYFENGKNLLDVKSFLNCRINFYNFLRAICEKKRKIADTNFKHAA